MTPTPIILLDSPADGYCEEKGWVETIVGEDAARDALAEFCADEDGEMPFRPTGPATKVTLSIVNPDDHYEDQRWHPALGGTEFWEVQVA